MTDQDPTLAHPIKDLSEKFRSGVRLVHSFFSQLHVLPYRFIQTGFMILGGLALFALIALRINPILLQRFSGLSALSPHTRSALTQIATTLLSDQQSSSNILGAQSKTSDTESAYDHTKQAYEYWKTVVATRQDYRDGYYVLALLSYQLNKTEESIMYLQKVKDIDPNYSGIHELEDLLTASAAARK